VAIGQQPHSEVAALALFLDSWYSSVATPLRFDAGEVKIMPSKSRKNVVTFDEEE
jgi:tRNA (cytidine56-2'-O)-methyltransferase